MNSPKLVELEWCGQKVYTKESIQEELLKINIYLEKFNRELRNISRKLHSMEKCALVCRIKKVRGIK
jgi:hypothetical protein